MLTSFATGQSTHLTDNTSGFTRRLAVSPNGTQLVYGLQTSGNAWDENPVTDLYRMNIDGSGSQLLVAGGRSPAWGVQPAPPTDVLYLPALLY